MKSINIRSLQHYLYCPHRWGLIELERVWSGNAFIARAKIVHSIVDEGKHRFCDKSKFVLSNVAVYSDEYDLYGVLDCIEFIKHKNGVPLKNYDGLYKISVVEYKPSAYKLADYRNEDALQVYAQKVCVDELFGSDCDAYLYYSDTRKRVKLDFATNKDFFHETLKRCLKEIRYNLDNNIIPKAEYGKKCNGCSLADTCLPKTNAKYSVQSQISKLKDEL